MGKGQDGFMQQMKNKKRGRALTKQALKIEKNEHGNDVQIPDQWSTALLQFCNSQFFLRGEEPKSMLASGQMLVKCDKMAVVTLEHYKELLALAHRGATYEAQLKAAVAELERAKRMSEKMAAPPPKKEEMPLVVPVHTMPRGLKP
jgi:hypothetical protein